MMTQTEVNEGVAYFAIIMCDDSQTSQADVEALFTYSPRQELENAVIQACHKLRLLKLLKRPSVSSDSATRSI